MHYRGGPRNSELLDITRKLRQDLTPAEATLWRELRGRRFLGLKFRRQHELVGYVLDFYCHELRLGIEVDGSSHWETDLAIEYDAKRARKIGMNGVTVVRFTNREVLHDLSKVLKYLWDWVRREEAKGR